MTQTDQARPPLLDRNVAADAAPRDDGDEGPPKDSSDPIALPLCGCPLPEGPHSLALPLLGCPAPGGREPDTEEVQALLRQDFHSFLVRAFATLYGDDFVPGWHIEVLAGKLAAIRAGGKRLVVMIPPRHLKSRSPPGCSARTRGSPSSTPPMRRTSPTSSPATAAR